VETNGQSCGAICRLSDLQCVRAWEDEGALLGDDAAGWNCSDPTTYLDCEQGLGSVEDGPMATFVCECGYSNGESSTLTMVGDDGPRLEICGASCEFANDASCDDGGVGSDYDSCLYGSDCADCGPRELKRTCGDNPHYQDGGGRWCEDFRTTGDCYTSPEVQENCPTTCGICDSRAMVSGKACYDTPGYRDPKGFDCSFWNFDDCYVIWTVNHYDEYMMREIRANCPLSCHICADSCDASEILENAQDAGDCTSRLEVDASCTNTPKRGHLCSPTACGRDNFLLADMQPGRCRPGSCDASELVPNAADAGNCTDALKWGHFCQNAPSPGFQCSATKCIDGNLSPGYCSNTAKSMGTVRTHQLNRSPTWGQGARNYFGSACVALGDLDGDGITDLAVGSSKARVGDLTVGAVYILFLQKDGSMKRHQKIGMGSGGFQGELKNNYNYFGERSPTLAMSMATASSTSQWALPGQARRY
jgi:hypothetical protein